MFDFSRILTKKELYKKVSDYQIMVFYYPALDYRRVVKSPFRKDNNPSFGIFKTHDFKTLYKDIATGQVGDGVKFVQTLYNLSVEDALNKINQDMDLGFNGTNIDVKLPITKGIIKKEPKNHIKYDITVYKRPWNKNDAKYWKQYGITLKMLKESNTYPIKAYRIGDGTTTIADTLAYCFDFYDDGDGIMLRKIYQPYSKEHKWRTNLTPLVVDGIKELPKTGKNLVITKSRKDRLTLIGLGINTIATNSETTFIPNSVLNKLKERFENVYILFDNDKTGKESSKKLSEKHSLINIMVPEAFGTKDISDFRKDFGKKLTENIIKSWKLK